MDKDEQLDFYYHKTCSAIEDGLLKRANLCAARAVSSRSSNLAAYMVWAFALEKQQKWDAAISKYKKAAAIIPSYVTPYNACGTILLNWKEAYEEAIIEFKKCIELGPFESAPYLNLGYTYHMMGHYDEAVKVYQDVIDMFPEYGYAYCYMAHALFEKEKPTKESIEICKTGARLLGVSWGLEDYKDTSFQKLKVYESKMETLSEEVKRKRMKRTIAALKFVLDILENKPLDDSSLVYD